MALSMLLMVVLSVALFLHPKVKAANPSIISFQGKVVNANGTNVTDGTYNFNFVLFDDPSLGTESDGVHDKWHELNKSVTVTAGVFQTNLGSATALPDFNANPSLYLAVKFNADAAGYMTPRVQMASVPYALNSDSLGGLASSAFAQLAANQTFTGTNIFQPTTNIASGLFKQTSFGTPSADIFNIQTANASSVMQVTGPAINEAAVTLQSVGATRAVTITSQAAATWSTVSGTLTVQAGGALNAVSAASSAANTGALTIASGNQTGSTLSSGSVTLKSGDASGGTNSSSGALSVDVGSKSGSGTVGALTIGATNATSIQLGNVTNTSNVVIKAAASTTALQVQNSTSANVLTIDTSGTVLNNLVTAASFENNTTTGWTGTGGCTLSAVTSSTSSPAGNQPFNGVYSGQCANTATAGAEFKFVTGALTASTPYTLNFYAKVSAGSGSVLSFGHVENGGAEDVAGLSLTSQTVTTNGWTKYSLTFKTGATLAAGDYVYIKQTDATARSVWLDAVTLQTDTNAESTYREGKVQIGGVVSSSLVLQNAANSSAAFQVNNASGAQVMRIDTTDLNLVDNPGAEVNAVGWTAKGAAAAPIRDTSQQVFGTASFKSVTTAAVGDGAQYTFATSLPVGTYAIGVSVKNSGTVFGAGALVAGLRNTAGDNDCVLSPTTGSTAPLTTGWTRFTCTVTIATTAATSFYVKQSEAVIHTFWFDGVEVDSGSTVAPYGVGTMSFNGVINTPLTLKNQSDSTIALSVQNSAGVYALQVDTLNNVVYIGNATADSTAMLLVIDSKNTAGDPTGINGGTYYNSYERRSRCYEDSTWVDCVGVERPNIRHWSFMNYPGSGTTFASTGDVTTAGTAPTAVAATTTDTGRLNYATTAATNATNSVSGNTNYDTDNRILYQTSASITITTIVRVWLGVTNQTAATMAASANPAGIYAAFRYDTGAADATYKCITKDNVTQNIIDSGIAPGTGGHVFEIRQNPTDVVFSIDGTKVCTSAANLPSANTLLRYANTITTLENVIKNLRIGWIYIESNI